MVDLQIMVHYMIGFLTKKYKFKKIEREIDIFFEFLIKDIARLLSLIRIKINNSNWDL